MELDRLGFNLGKRLNPSEPVSLVQMGTEREVLSTDPDQERAGGSGGIRVNDNKNNPHWWSAYHVKSFTWIISLFYSQQPYKGGAIILAIL